MRTGPRPLDAVKAFEDALPVLGRDAGAIVGHDEPRPSVLDVETHHHFGAGVTRRVVEQDPHDLAQRVVIALDGRRRGLDLQ